MRNSNTATWRTSFANFVETLKICQKLSKTMQKSIKHFNVLQHVACVANVANILQMFANLPTQTARKY